MSRIAKSLCNHGIKLCYEPGPRYLVYYSVFLPKETKKFNWFHLIVDGSNCYKSHNETPDLMDTVILFEE